jgi:hypothetical protein
VNACRGCNNDKADLENDISAITMQPDVLGKPFSDHVQLVCAHCRRLRGLDLERQVTC